MRKYERDIDDDVVWGFSSIDELCKTLAPYFRKFMTLQCPCGVLLERNATKKQWKEHLKHRFYYG